jgi:hypothetical protein
MWVMRVPLPRTDTGEQRQCTALHPRLALLTGTIAKALDDLFHASILILLLMCTFAAIATWRFGTEVWTCVVLPGRECRGGVLIGAKSLPRLIGAKSLLIAPDWGANFGFEMEDRCR